MPRRRCVGCGRIAPKQELVRVALAAPRGDPGPLAVLDRRGTMPGRGAYLCRVGRADAPLGACLARAVRNGGIRRTLRCSATLDPKLIESMGR